MRIAIAAEGDFHRNNRLLKFARSLTAAGHTVLRIGIQISNDAPLHEVTPEGEIIRVPTAIAGDIEMQGTTVDPRAITRSLLVSLKRLLARFGPTDDLRHYFGRKREARLIYGALRTWNPECVICVNPPMMPVGDRAKREAGARFVYDAQEIWVEMYPRRRRILRSLYDRLERRLSRRADLVITVNEEIADLMAHRYRIPVPMVVMSGSDTCMTPTPVHTPLRVFFQGAFAPDRDLMPFILQMGNLRGAAILTLQGFGPMEENWRQAVADHGLGDVVHFIDPCPPADVVESANEHDVGVIVYQLTSLNIVYSSPNKLFDYVGAGLALLSVDAPVMRRLITTSGCGALVDSDAIDSAWETISELAANPERVSAMKAASHQLCSSLMWGAQVAPLIEWLRDQNVE